MAMSEDNAFLAMERRHRLALRPAAGRLGRVALALAPAAVGVGAAAGRAATHRVHPLRSPHLGNAATECHVLLPRSFDPSSPRRYRVLYMLPVVCGEADGVPAWGSPLAVAQQHGFADTHDVIVVMATFPSLTKRPNTMYVNHPTRADMQDEDYFVKDVVPLIDRLYPTIAKPCGRLLVGFCASGNGATWLLLRHLELFGKSAVWETWLDLSRMHPPDADQLGSDATFQQYCALNLIEEQAAVLRDGPTRLVILSCRPDRDPTSSLATSVFQAKLFDLQIPHLFELHGKEEHRWDSGWLPRAVSYLFAEPLPEDL